MLFEPGRSKKTESIVSFLLLIALAAIAVAVVVKQSHFDPAHERTAQPTSIDLEQMLANGFTKMTPPEHFDIESLYVKINGKAELYLPAGFTELTTLRMADAADENSWAEIYLYDMATPRGSFAVFSAQRRSGVENLTITDFSYRSQNAVFFAKGKYYIEIIASAKNDKLDNAMIETAKSIIASLPGQDQWPTELELFPAKSLIPQSYKLITKDAFGLQGFDNVFIAKYDIDGEQINAFIAKRDNPKQAKQLVNVYREFLIENGATHTQTSTPVEFHEILDFYGTTEVFGSIGNFVYGVHEADNQQAATKAASLIKKSIKDK